MINRLNRDPQPAKSVSSDLVRLLDRIDDLRIHFTRNRRGRMVIDYEISGSLGDFCPDEFAGDGSPTEQELRMVNRLIQKAMIPIEPDNDGDDELAEVDD